MSDENILHRHELRVVFEEEENSVITWTVEADPAIEDTRSMSCEHLTEAGAPLAALGIKVLREILCEQVIELALNKADNYRWRRLFQQIQNAEDEQPAPLEKPELRLIH
jgi:hypothetical protein